MSRLRIATRDGAPAASKPILDIIYERLGVLPNVSRLIASSPTALAAFSAFQDGLSGTFSAKTHERIALAVAQVNGSDYCLSAHSYLATNFAHLPPDEIVLNRRGASRDPSADAAVRFATKVAEKRGHVSDGDIAEVREAGYDDPQIVEIIALVAENVFTNCLNQVASTEIDYPIVRAETEREDGEL